MAALYRTVRRSQIQGRNNLVFFFSQTRFLFLYFAQRCRGVAQLCEVLVKGFVYLVRPKKIKIKIKCTMLKERLNHLHVLVVDVCMEIIKIGSEVLDFTFSSY